MEAIIETKNLNFKYKDQKAICDLNLEVPKHSIYGFLGPNGAGKSTTIKLLLGLLQSKEENIFLFGKKLNSNKYEILRNIGNLIETPTVYGHLTAYENIKYLSYIYKKREDRIEELFKIIELWDSRNMKVKSFSTGMKQRLGIGIALFHNPELIILDEPVNGLDPSGIQKIRKILQNLQSEGKTIFISSHILSEIEKLCSYIGIINKGKLIYQGKMMELVSQTSKNVLLSTNDNMKAINVLRKNEVIVLNDTKEIIECKMKNNSDFNNLITTLVKEKIEIYDIEKSSSSLEDIFINLTSK